jgi:hypothetical protein
MKRAIAAAAVSLLVQCSFAFSQQPPSQGHTFSVTGRSGSAKILESNGKSYVALDDIARLMQGSLSFKGNQIILTLPADQAAAAAPAPPAKTGFSKDFLNAELDQLSVIREWRIALVESMKKNFPASEGWIGEVRRKAEEKLAIAAAARSTSDDEKGYSLLAAELANMEKYSDRYLQGRSQMQYTNPNSVENDPLERQIQACARSLSSMAAESHFREEPACSEFH